MRREKRRGGTPNTRNAQADAQRGNVKEPAATHYTGSRYRQKAIEPVATTIACGTVKPESRRSVPALVP